MKTLETNTIAATIDRYIARYGRTEEAIQAQKDLGGLLVENERFRQALKEIAATQTLGRDVVWCVGHARSALSVAMAELRSSLSND